MELSRLTKRFRSLQIPSRKILNPLANNWLEKYQNQNDRSMMKLRSQSSCGSYLSMYRVSNRKNSSANKNLSINPNKDKEFIPSQAKGFNEMVKKKHKLLIIKHRIKDQDHSIPNLLEIKESVKISHINFIRRMDVKLNNNQHAPLLSNLKKDLHLKSKNYLKQANQKNKQNRRNLARQENTHQQTSIHKTSINYRWFFD